MQPFHTVPIDELGQLKLLSELETIIKRKSATLVIPTWSDIPGNKCVVTVTTHRICLNFSGFPRTAVIPLESVSDVSVKTRLFGSAKLSFAHRSVDQRSTARTVLKCDDKPAKSLEKAIRRALKDRQWEKAVISGRAQTFTTRAAGIAGLKAEKAAEHQKTSNIIDGAFSDLKTLMTNAKSVIAVSERLSRTAADSAEVGALVRDFGIMSSASVSGSSDTALARECAAFFASLLNDSGKCPAGMLAMPTAYAIFNRSRGTQLVSPTDFAGLVQEASKTGAFGIEAFNSGLKAVVVAGFGEKIRSMIDTLLESPATGEPRGLSAAECASQLSLPLALANDQLELLAAAGSVVRDCTAHGTLFWRNLFGTF